MAFGIGIGTKVEIGKGSTPTWTELSGVLDINLPTSEAEEIDTTNMSSTGFTREYIRGLKDNGDLTIDMIWDPASVTDVLLTELESGSGEIVQVRVTVPGVVEIFTYRGFLKSYAHTIPVGDKMTTAAVFKVSTRIVE